MKRLFLLGALITVIGFAIIIGAAPPAEGSSPNAPCCDGGGEATCTWYGIVTPNISIAPCGVNSWTRATISTTGCCAQGNSTTGFWYGYSDVRTNNVSGLTINAHYPNRLEAFTLSNLSNGSIWYWLYQTVY